MALAGLAALALSGVFWNRHEGGKSPAVTQSIAVLPFLNLSSDKDQEYFSDGLAEELLNGLSRIPNLRVTGRTSSFQFRGKTEDSRAIGQKLNVAMILEGSVRKTRLTHPDYSATHQSRGRISGLVGGHTIAN